MSQMSEGIPLLPLGGDAGASSPLGHLLRIIQNSDEADAETEALDGSAENILETRATAEAGNSSAMALPGPVHAPYFLVPVGDAHAAPAVIAPQATPETQSLAEGSAKGGGGTGRGGVLEVSASYPVPGVLERLRLIDASGIPHDDPRIAQVLPLPQLLGFIRDTGVVREDALNLLIGDEKYVAAIRRGFIDTLLMRLAMFRKRSAVDSEMWIPVAEIHCPQVEGCEATYEWGAEHNKHAQLRVTLLGCGGGGGMSSELKFRREIKAQAGCRRVLVKAKVILEEWRADPDGQVLNIINVREITSGVQAVGFTPDEVHRCSGNLDQVQRWIAETEATGYELCDTPYDLTWTGGGKAELTEELEVRKGTMLETSVSAVFHGIDIALELKSEVIRTFGYSYKLTEPWYYLGFYGGPGSSSYSWAWRAAQP